MKALAFSPSALFRLSQFEISREWFSDFLLPAGAEGFKRVKIDEIVYFLEPDLDQDNTPLVVVSLAGENPVFCGTHRDVYILERIITVARSIFTNSVRIPVAWREYHERSLLSIYVSNRQKGDGSRINFDSRPNGEDSLFVFAVTKDAFDLNRIPRNEDLYQLARENLADAILSDVPSENESTSRAGIVLSSRLPQGFAQGATLKQWYESMLRAEQRNFVDKSHDGPVRLRGAAGTGKTLSLVVKVLRDGEVAELEKRPAKYGFLTHSLASVDMVSALTESLDTRGLLSGGGQSCSVELRTLYDLAHQHLKFNLDDLKPLSLDGREGRRLQFELISSTLKEMHTSPIIQLQYEDLTAELATRWCAAASGHDPKFITEMMNEFASVLDAEGVRAGEEKGERYSKGSLHRANWLIPLDKEIDRRFVLEVHRRYRTYLSEMNTLSVDQMIADFNSFLDSNRWDSLRNRYGYDALFVDELHLFTGVERQLLHKLIKRSVDASGTPMRPPIFMAYDLKQSPNDAFASLDSTGTIFSSGARLQNSELIKLEKVFRYTPEIADFLSDLDATFPAIDIPGEWDAYSGKAQLANGDAPELLVFRDEKELFRSIFDQARSLARTISGGGRRVAVLCASDEMFDTYLEIATGQYEGSIFPITSREPSSELRHAGKRFIFSMPEYVAGLQFDTVFLLHADAVDAPADASVGLKRRFISNVYLGSSRAERVLKLGSCQTRGGPSDVLNMAISRGSLKKTVVSSQKKR